MKINLFINLNVSSSYMLINYQIMNEKKMHIPKKDDLRRLISVKLVMFTE